jgi:di/tricarboxylate transporter
MTTPILLLLSMLFVAIVLMATERLRADVVALLVAIALTLTGLIQPTDTFSGFSRSAVVTIMAIFVLTGGLAHTGVTRAAGRVLLRIAGKSEAQLIALIMLGGAGFSLFMNNIAAAAVLLPGVMDAARRSPLRVSPSRLLMPLAFATILGGMATLLTTANILVSTALRDSGLNAFRLLDFAPVGVPIVIVGTAYIVFVGRKLLPERHPRDQLGLVRHLRAELTELYALQERLSEVRVPADSLLVGKSIAESDMGDKYGLSLMAIVRNTHVTLAPQPSDVMHAGDLLVVAGRMERVLKLAEEQKVQIESELPWHGDLSSDEIGMAEVLVAPRSRAAGKTLSEIHFREKFGMMVVALWREGRSIRTDLGKLPLRFGDALLAYGPLDRVRVLQAEADFIVLQQEDQPVVRPRRAAWAVVIMVVALGLAAANVLPIAEATMLGALAMVLTGCLTMDEAYQSIEWRAIFLIAGMVPVSIAMNRTGAAEYLGQLLVNLIAPWGPLALMAGIFLATTLLTQLMPGQVTALVLAPIAISAARKFGMSPYALAMTVALGTSMAFLTPLGHPVNVLVMGSGGYKFSDYFKVGAPMTALLFVVVLVFLPIFWPLR